MHVDKRMAHYFLHKKTSKQKIIVNFFPASSTSNRHSVTITSSDGETSFSSPSNPSRVSAIRELIETEQRYVDDLLTVANQFIKPLNTARVLSDHEIEKLFINWYSLIALNSSLLKALYEQVDYHEQNHISDSGVMMRTPRSASMSNIALAATQVSTIRSSSLSNLFF